MNMNILNNINAPGISKGCGIFILEPVIDLSITSVLSFFPSKHLVTKETFRRGSIVIFCLMYKKYCHALRCIISRNNSQGPYHIY